MENNLNNNSLVSKYEKEIQELRQQIQGLQEAGILTDDTGT